MGETRFEVVFRVVVVCFLVVGLLGVGMVAAVAHSSSSGASSTLEPVELSDPDELERFIDPIFSKHMDEHDIPGAVFVMVKDGEIFLSKGYGYADRENQVPAEPERTIFDLGSIGKLFTATAVMQLVEQGRIDLHADVNTYLTEFQVPATYDEPITMHHLLTHTAGFDERFYTIGLVAPAHDETEPLGENLSKHLPPRVRPPGEVFKYSNAGITLAGHVVETVSGQPFDEYVIEHVLVPLGMERSAYGLPEHLVPDMAMGYTNFPPDLFSPYDTWHIHQKPAAGVRGTGHDMAAFMLAYLNGGEYDGARILEPETVEQMHSQQFTGHPDVSGIGYGFWEHRTGERRGVHHGGQWVGFSNLLYLLPDEDVGIIVSYNNGDGVYIQDDLIEALLDRYFPVPMFDSQPAGDDASRVEGQYRTNRVDHHTFMSLPSVLLTQTIDVTARSDGSIDVSMSPALMPDGNWVSIGPGVYGERGGTNVIAFDLDGNGSARAAHLGWPLLMTMDRIAWYQSATLHLGLLALFLVTFASTLGWPLGRLYRRLRGRSFPMPTDLRRARLAGGLISGLIFAFLIGLLVYAAADLPGLSQVPVTVTLLLWLPIIAAILTIPLVILVVRL
jgi:CubicO group peptidase (beta-lactamase class C family)